MANDIQVIRALLKATRPKLFDRANVVATGVGYKFTAGKRTAAISIVCSVTKKIPRDELSERDWVPPVIDGIPTDVIQTGIFRAHQSHTSRQRPAPGGISIGHKDITAGTLGCLVKKNGQPVILSNNHVLADSNAASVGDPILQPGPHDGGKFPDDHIADLLQFVPITFAGAPSDCPVGRGVAGVLNGMARLVGSATRFSAVRPYAGENLVDCALARPLNPGDVTDNILEIGTIPGRARGDLGQGIKKSGRTTGLTQGEITQVDVSVNVQYGPGQVALFTDQLMAGPMSQGGDSGSAVLDNNNRLVGLLFAGSDNSTIINRIEHVFSALGVSL
jgi:hypothetical protein